MDFEAKRKLIVETNDELVLLSREFFPIGGAITWRTENSFNCSGVVTAHRVNGVFGVQEDRSGFFASITLADIMRATP